MVANPKVVNFIAGGKVSQHSIPGAYSEILSAGTPRGTVNISNLVFLGTSLGGGEPKKVQWFTDPEEARQALIGGDLVEVIREAFNPGNDLRPQQVGYMRINTATQSNAVLQASAVDKVDLLSRDYGAYTKQISYKLEDGTVAGSKKFSEKYKDNERVIDNIILESFSIIYTGAGTPAVLDITETALTTTVTGGPGGEDLNFLFADYETIGELIDAINNAAGGVYTATLLNSNSLDPSNELDIVTAQDILTAYNVTANVQALIDAITNQAQYMTASLSAGATRVMPDNVVAYERLIGGTDGASTVTEWTEAFQAAEAEDIQLIGIDVDSAAIVNIVKTHITKMNSRDGKSERQSIVGAETNFDNGLVQAVGLNKDAMNICWMDFTNRNSSQDITDFTSIHYAAKLLGQASASNLNEPLTFKNLDVVENKTKLNTVQKQDAIKAGLIVPETTSDGLTRTVRSITTYQGADIKFAEFSAVREMLFIARDLRTAMENAVVGKPGIKGKIAAVDAVWEEKMRDYEDDFEIIISDPDNPIENPAAYDYSRVVEGDVIRVKFKARIVMPINFVFIINEFDILVQT